MFCLRHTENDRKLFQTIINKCNCFEECDTNPLTHVNDPHSPLYAFMGKQSVSIGLERNGCCVRITGSSPPVSVILLLTINHPFASESPGLQELFTCRL